MISDEKINLFYPILNYSIIETIFLLIKLPWQHNFDDLPIIVKCQLTQVGFMWFMPTELTLIEGSFVLNLLTVSST